MCPCPHLSAGTRFFRRGSYHARPETQVFASLHVLRLIYCELETKKAPADAGALISVDLLNLFVLQVVGLRYDALLGHPEAL